jgi:hypothetical protein
MSRSPALLASPRPAAYLGAAPSPLPPPSIGGRQTSEERTHGPGPQRLVALMPLLGRCSPSGPWYHSASCMLFRDFAPHLSVRPSVRPSVCLSWCWSGVDGVRVCLSVCLPACLSVRPRPICPWSTRGRLSVPAAAVPRARAPHPFGLATRNAVGAHRGAGVPGFVRRPSEDTAHERAAGARQPPRHRCPGCSKEFLSLINRTRCASAGKAHKHVRSGARAAQKEAIGAGGAWHLQGVERKRGLNHAFVHKEWTAELASDGHRLLCSSCCEACSRIDAACACISFRGALGRGSWKPGKKPPDSAPLQSARVV